MSQICLKALQGLGTAKRGDTPPKSVGSDQGSLELRLEAVDPEYPLIVHVETITRELDKTQLDS